MIETLLHDFKTLGDKIAIITPTDVINYNGLSEAVTEWESEIISSKISNGQVVLLKGDFSKNSISALLALLKKKMIVILLAPQSYELEEEYCEIGNPEFVIDSSEKSIKKLNYYSNHQLYEQLRKQDEAGIILFSSGSSGKPKGTVHNASKLFQKFRTSGKSFRTLAFLLFDHIAGIDTLFYNLFNQSTLILPKNRQPENIFLLIEEHKIEVLPTAPSFLNLMLLSGAHKKYDISSLKIITYGSEMMPVSTLRRCADELPHVRLLQKYGTSEIGALPTKSKSNDSIWLKLGGRGFDWRVQDDMLEIKATTAMIGYLNAPSPFTDDGYFKTGDKVETDGEYIKFLGRKSDIINVGGQKVFPAEVENAIRQIHEIHEVSVYGEEHAILGSVVVAKIRPLSNNLDVRELRKLIRKELFGKIESFKIPQKYVLSNEQLSTARGKQIRKSGA